MSRSVLLFIAVSLAVTAGAFALIIGYTPLSTMQIAGTAGAFFLGWCGLAVAGSSAIRGMLRRRFTQRTAARRNSAFVKASKPASERAVTARPQPLARKHAGREAAVTKRLTFKD